MNWQTNIALNTVSFTQKRQGVYLFFVILSLFSLLLPEAFVGFSPDNYLLPIVLFCLLFENLERWFRGLVLFFTLALTFRFLSVYTSDVSGLNSLVYQFRYLKFGTLMLVCSRLDLTFCREFLVKYIHFITAFILFICALQIINPFDWGENLNRVYSNHQVAFNNNENFDAYYRLLGIANNPNDMGIILGAFILFYLSYLKVSLNRLVLFTLFLLFGALFLTQSRTSFLALMFAALMFLLSFRFSIRQVSIGLGGIAVLLLILYSSDLQYLADGIFQNPLKSRSITTRMDIWQGAINQWQQRPFLGNGIPSGGRMILDSEYVRILSEFGIVGLCFHLLVLLAPVFLFWKSRKQLFSQLAILLSVFYIFCSFTNYTLSASGSALIYAIFIGLALAENRLRGVSLSIDTNPAE